jgi:hypothetical protein
VKKSHAVLATEKKDDRHQARDLRTLWRHPGKRTLGQTMNKENWSACANAWDMLESLRGKASERKLRLLACAFCRRISHLLTPEDYSDLELGEKVAEGLLPVDSPVVTDARNRRYGTPPFPASMVAAKAPLLVNPFLAAGAGASSASDALADSSDGSKESTARLACKLAEQKEQAGLVRDVFGHLYFSGKVDSSWLRWNDGMVPDLARSIYKRRRFEDMPILHDALLDAGCDNQDILDHCESPGPHVRGCWVLDQILGWE